ncbi:AraC family transcriptional regulator [Streptomyces albiflavescens]|uniref:AraC family transcriptional regulator n=1 Tax=Streptomyces albiflavescens TaxID=1623582 RepID=A0A917YC69_9ACTN|nr:helix-turn-helix domain-containing protein [Streptomyces albiflavescens]GGN88375.1 AraC family transcriptional regulator [Streptomyces albiflavescens]
MLTTRSVPERESLEFWHDAVLATLVGMDIRAPGGTYDATLRTHHLGALQITKVDCDPGEVHRSPRFVARGDGRQVFVAVQVSGVAQVEQDGRTTELRVGDIGFFDTARPFRARFPEPFTMKIFALPRELLGRPEADLRMITARALQPSHGLPALLSPFLSTLAETPQSYTAYVGERLATNVADLLAATAAECLGRRPTELPGAKRAMLLRVQSFIRWNLADPALTPQAIARAHSISVRYLHRLFEGEGTTVSSWVRQLRLQEVRKDLAASSATGPVDLSQVARSWGFSSTAQLGRAFRTCQGLSPTEWLRRERGDALCPGAN